MNTWIEAIIHQASRMPRTYGLVVLVLPVHIADKHGMQMIADPVRCRRLSVEGHIAQSFKWCHQQYSFERAR
jgi:hypothetical protein